MTPPYRLTRRALRDLRDIYTYSTTKWGEDRASAYVGAFYHLFETNLDLPSNAARSRRSAPFQMIACQQHFVIFDVRPEAIYIVAIMHQSRDVERRVAELTRQFRQDIAAL